MARTVPGLLSVPRVTTLVASILVGLGSGTNYVPYSPQLGTRLNINHTQLNIIGLAGNAGVYVCGPLSGRVVDARGPRILFALSLVFLFLGYTGIRHFYDAGVPAASTLSGFSLALLVACSFLTGAGGDCGYTSAINSTAKSFPDKARATTMGLVVSGYGLSAFVFTTLARSLFPGNISSLLLLLSYGTPLLAVVGFFFVRAVPLSVVEHANTTPHCAIEPSGKEEEVNVHGRALLLSPEFWLLGTILAILSGTGVMYINNVGSMSRLLFAKENPAYDELEAARWQAQQVSTFSIVSFTSRILIGLLSDNAKTHFGLPRSYALVLVSTLLFFSQLLTAQITDVAMLWKASALVGLAYGALFGMFPIMSIEFFGLPHLSENNGYLALWLFAGSNIFTIAFGRNLDRHMPGHSTVSALDAAPAGPQCLEGRSCYVATFGLTTAACFAAMFLSAVLAWRDRRRLIAGSRPRVV
ncbi:major facilitator superfamily domain-containing protein [Mycena crocata]|nr:major facilitator superfamily domain-containing protein [Mycena crocata]